MQQSVGQLPIVNISRANTLSRLSIPETIPECDVEECNNHDEKSDREDFEFSTSLAYGAVSSATLSRLRLESDVESISSDFERMYCNPIYEGNPIYECIKPCN